MKRLNKLNEAHAIARQARHTLMRIDALKLSVQDRAKIADELIAAHEAIEFLSVRLQLLVVDETRSKK